MLLTFYFQHSFVRTTVLLLRIGKTKKVYERSLRQLHELGQSQNPNQSLILHQSRWAEGNELAQVVKMLKNCKPDWMRVTRRWNG